MDPISSALSRVMQSGVVGPTRPIDSGAITVPVIGPESSGGPTFGDTLKKFVGEVSAQQDAAADLQGRFLRGDNVELHQVMAATEEAGISLDLMVELRNKVTDAYRTLVSIQA